jgi:thiol-disulfide isomerase/thioredoxin
MTQENTQDTAPTLGRRALGFAKELALIILLLGAVSAYQGRHLLPTRTAAPAVALTTLDGEATTLARLVEGKKTVLVLWAPWCGVCKAEVGALNSLAARLEPDEQLISIAFSFEDRDQIARFIREHDVRYPVLLG